MSHVPGIGADMGPPGPLGMGAIGRDYNIQLDKVEKYRQQGTWTEEDDRQWARRKPFPCDICGDRVSSRANLNRHIKTRHFPPQEHDNKRFACDICGKVCKREDNVVKHKKQKHSIITPANGRNRRASNPHRASFPGPGYGENMIPPGWNWQDPRNVNKMTASGSGPPGQKHNREVESESESESDSDQETPDRDRGSIERRYTNDDDLMNLTSDFRRIAVAEDLPSKPVRGLKKYYTDFPILPQELLSHYADYYFTPSSTAFHPHLPLIHQPTFFPESVLASFLRAICCIGGLYDPTDRTLGRQLWESGWKVMERWVEWGVGDDDDAEEEEFVDGLSMPKWKTDQVLTRIREEAEMGGTMTAEDERRKNAGRRHREKRLCVLQAFLLFECFGVFNKEREWHKKGRRLHARCVEIAREYGYFVEDNTATPTVNKADDPAGYLQQEWEIFIERESRKRVSFCLYLLDCHLSLLFNIPPLLRPTELRNLSLPCDEDLFNAATASDWDFTRRMTAYEKVPVMFLKTLRGILKGNMNAVNQELNDFSTYILVVAILIEITKVSQKVAVEEDETYDDGRPRIVVFMPREQREDVERLEAALDTLRTLSSHRDDFFERHVGKSPDYSAYSPSSQRSQQSDHFNPIENLTGCTKCFYILWHLAFVFLVVPDRLVLSGDVPISMEGCLQGIVSETRTRLERDEEMDVATLEEAVVKLHPHLLAVMRFLENRTYDESRTEFPAIVALAFRACMVIWEIIVRVNFFQLGAVSEGDDSHTDMGGNLVVGSIPKTYSMTNLTSSVGSLKPSYSSIGLSSALGVGRSTDAGEAFVREVMECIHLPAPTDDSTAERAETRFIRWVQATFDDMVAWDVGPAVSAAVEGIVEDWEALGDDPSHSQTRL